MKQPADLIIKQASELVTVGGASHKPKIGGGLQELGIIKDGAVAVSGGKIAAVGCTREILGKFTCATVIDAAGKVVMPGLVDPHSHLVFAGSRHQEYEAKITGATYLAAHRSGGGIQHTVDCTRKAPKSRLREEALSNLDICLQYGTTTVEIKSGYGLNRENELKILEVIRELKEQHPVDIVPTFLGAHTIPREYQGNRSGYIALVKSMLPDIRNQGLAEYCDVFCDQLGFSLSETREILEEASHYGFKLKLHAEQTSYLGGIELAAEMGATSADHLDFIGEPQESGVGWRLNNKHIRKFAEAGVVGVLLPGVTYHLMEMVPGSGVTKSFLPATVQCLVEEGVAIALATNFNPGSCRTQSMQAIMEIAARLYRMSPAQIINAVTINAAHAVDRASQIGSLEAGKIADIVVFNHAEHGMLIESFGINLVDKVIKDGRIVIDNCGQTLAARTGNR